MRSELRILLGTLALAPVAAFGPRLVDAMAEMQTFRIAEVDVAGTQYMARDSVVAQMRLGPFASVWGDRDAWAERLEGHPLVRHAEVRRRLPNGLRVEIDERVPVALAAAPTLEPVDVEGVRLPIDPTRTPLDLPVISARRMPPSDAAVFPAEVRALAAEMGHLEALDAEFARRISTIRRAADGAVVLRLVAPETEVVLPSRVPLGRLREAQTALTHAISVDPGRVPSVVDLRFADQVVVRRDR
jgi:cell division septal protein FtsQ